MKIRLSQRQEEVLHLLKTEAGITNKEIAARLNISHRTAKFHVSNLLERAGVSNRTRLLEWGPQEISELVVAFGRLPKSDQFIAKLAAAGLESFRIEKLVQSHETVVSKRLGKIYYALGICEIRGESRKRELTRILYRNHLVTKEIEKMADEAKAQYPAISKSGIKKREQPFKVLAGRKKAQWKNER